MAFTSDTKEATRMLCQVTGNLEWLSGIVVEVKYPDHTVEKKEIANSSTPRKEGIRINKYGQEIDEKILGQCQIPWLHCNCNVGHGRRFL